MEESCPQQFLGSRVTLLILAYVLYRWNLGQMTGDETTGNYTWTVDVQELAGLQRCEWIEGGEKKGGAAEGDLAPRFVRRDKTR